MNTYELNTDLLIGIEPIDRHHRELFSSLYDIHLGLTEKADEGELARAFHMVVVDLEECFTSVEELWNDIDYPEAAEHAAAHETLSVDLLKIDWDFVNGKAKLSDEVLKQVVQRLGRHIVEWDKPLAARYIKQADS